MSEAVSFGPASEKQAMFLQSEAKIVVYGGAAGAGKSYCGLLHHLKYIDDPNYRGYVIRKNSTMLMKSGGLFDAACSLYKAFEPRVKIGYKNQLIKFPSGAVIAFSHYEDDKAGDTYQGIEISSILYDEATQAAEGHILWLLSRLRSKAKMDGNIRLTCNPDPSSYLRKWIDWYLYPKDHPLFGRPDPEKDGRIRWFIQRNNQMIWGDSREELVEKYGDKAKPLSFQFISARIYDNPPVIEANPDYLTFLENLKRVEKERLLEGNWEAREESSGFFKREWVEPELIDYPSEDEIEKVVRAYDLAGTLASESNPNPDYTASVKMARLKSGQYVILDVCRLRARYGDLMVHILKNAEQDGHGVDVILPIEPGQAGKAAAQMMIRQIAENGYYAKGKTTNRSKLERFRPFAAAAESGSVKIVKGCANCLESGLSSDNDFFYKEMEDFVPNNRNQKDDMVDACGDAFLMLAQKITIPNFLPGMTGFGFEQVKNPLTSIR